MTRLIRPAVFRCRISSSLCFDGFGEFFVECEHFVAETLEFFAVWINVQAECGAVVDDGFQFVDVVDDRDCFFRSWSGGELVQSCNLSVDVAEENCDGSFRALLESFQEFLIGSEIFCMVDGVLKNFFVGGETLTKIIDFSGNDLQDIPLIFGNRKLIDVEVGD